MRIASHVDDDANKLFYLDQQLTDEPKELSRLPLYEFKGWIQKGKVEKDYGDHNKISIGYIDRLLSWPKLKDEDP